MLEKLTLVLVTATITTLVNFLVNTVSTRKTISNLSDAAKEFTRVMLKESFEVHNNQFHGTNVYDVAKEFVSTHATQCNGAERLHRIELSLAYLVAKQGGSPEEAGITLVT
jgi:hypothetical protein